MERNISHSTAYFVLDDEKSQSTLRPPPGLYLPPAQVQAQSYMKPLAPPPYQPSSYQSIYQPKTKIEQPVQLKTKMAEIVEKYTPYEPNKNLEKKKKLEHDLIVSKQIVSLLEKELEKLNDQIEIEIEVNLNELNF